ncbi:hypothetical protein [Neorhizobium petrolearium]|uniref:Uncharacterized protein n=1 Tax=Neorhizobium petrolearium TaxID=515361 RepID=A0ABY8M0C1_9HYPH|nr:hypothetical protein [Neorhizobium petrolearium]MCC2612640.1 hypothetical protein [Neorhizobium petrolearium]WGI67763.1 hypothetical protein QEO92_22700 [Neorhizobium petrolearium]
MNVTRASELPMTRASFRQADIERIIRAAEKTGATVQVDLRSLVVTIFPGTGLLPKPAPPLHFTPDGKENWGSEDWSDTDTPDAMGRVYSNAPEPIQPPLDFREKDMMERLVALGVGNRVHSSGHRNFGPSTQNKLLDRGYVEVTHQPGNKFNDDEICLTKKGMADWKALKDFRSKYWSL